MSLGDFLERRVPVRELADDALDDAARKLLSAIDDVLDEYATLDDESPSARRGALILKWGSYTELLRRVNARRRERTT